MAIVNKKALKEHRELKGKQPKHLVLLRKGDFYLTFEDDARKASEVLGITLLNGVDYVYALFPYKYLDDYMPKLIKAGVRLAIQYDV